MLEKKPERNKSCGDIFDPSRAHTGASIKSNTISACRSESLAVSIISERQGEIKSSG